MHIVIEFLPHGANHWERLGDFRASDSEIAELRAVLEGRDPFEALADIKHPMMRDILDVLQKEGHDARVTFREEDA